MRRPSRHRTSPFPNGDTAILANFDTRILKRDDPVPTSIHIKVDDDTVTHAFSLGGGLAAVVFCMTQMVVQEAPAWAVSMVVHMVTLVTMAMVTTSQPIPFKAQHLVITPESERVEDLLDNEPLFAASGENAPLEDVAFQAEFENSGPAFQAAGDLMFADSDAADAAVAIETGDIGGLPYVPPSALVSMIGGGGYGSSFSRGGFGAARRARLVKPVGPNEATEKAVAAALKWLANHQDSDGGWRFNHGICPSCRGQCKNEGRLEIARNAATALALLPFLGSGQTHRDSKRYKSTISNGLNFLINHMRVGPNGGALNEPGGNMYSHGIASIVLCEAYAMTHDKNLLLPAGSAINFICFAQDPVSGGWRYQPHDRGDTSVLGWQLMALKSGYMAGLTIPPATIRKASQFLDSVQSDGGTRYGYVNAGKGTEATVAIGLLSRMYLGWKRDNPTLRRGVEWLAKRGPSPNNMYYNYYATQVMRHWDGEEWVTWNRQMRDQLIHTQARQGHEKGSWFVGGGDFGALTGGRLYCTAMSAMILEVYHRYMPIYGSQSVEDDFPE